MKLSNLLFIIVISLFNGHDPILITGGQNTMPESWIDQDTGHKVKRLTSLDGNYRSFYFHNYPFIIDKNGKDIWMVYYGSKENMTDDNRIQVVARQIFAINLNTGYVKPISKISPLLTGEIVAPKNRKVYYQIKDSIFATDIESLKTEFIFKIPDNIRAGISSINASEDILAGVYSQPLKDSILINNPSKSSYFTRIFEAKLPHYLFIINIKTKKMEVIHSDTAWINHVQFSPTDPDLLMFCHEGPWHLVNRIWTINIKTREIKLMHKRTMPMEIAGHEFFSRDGNFISYDLQIPRSENFYLAGVNPYTGEKIRYKLKRDEWSIHYNISPDGNLFAGDGGDSSQVAKAKNGHFIYLFYPQGDSLKSEKLVNLKFHDYRLEPNVHFSPDKKYIIFRANFEGKSQIYAVEIKKK